MFATRNNSEKQQEYGLYEQQLSHENSFQRGEKLLNLQDEYKATNRVM
jgi:hypothetical protein